MVVVQVRSWSPTHTPVGCHTWRATGITIYLENDGRLEHAQQMAGHESPRTTKLYSRSNDEFSFCQPCKWARRT